MVVWNPRSYILNKKKKDCYLTFKLRSWPVMLNRAILCGLLTHPYASSVLSVSYNQWSLEPGLPLELFRIIPLTVITSTDHINRKAKHVSKMSLLEHSWAHAKVPISKTLKIHGCKILQQSYPYCQSHKCVKIGILNIISDFFIWIPFLVLWEYTIGQTLWLLIPIVTLVLCQAVLCPK